VIGTNIPYAPAEFLDTAGRVVGFDVDLMNAVAEQMGVRTAFRETEFSAIIPSVSSGTFDVGMAAVTDTREREQVVDMVTYYCGGTMWARSPESQVSPDDACGRRVAVQATTSQQTLDLPDKTTHAPPRASHRSKDSTRATPSTDKYRRSTRIGLQYEADLPWR
jgi:polar amino acid transport system substrate-binding protein